MKSIKKILSYLLVLVIGILYFNCEVEAKEPRKWNYLFNPYQFPGVYADMEYCSYSRNNVFEFTAGTELGSITTNAGSLYNGSDYDQKYRHFAFIYDNIENQIKFVTGYKIGDDGITTGVFEVIPTVNGEIKWNNKPKQYITFMTDLNKYLIEDGKLKCNPLVFIQENDNLKVFRGDKHLYGEWSHDLLGSDAYGYTDEEVITLKQAYDEAGASGYLYYNAFKFLDSIRTSGTHNYGTKLVSSCDEKLNLLDEIWAEYDSTMRVDYNLMKENVQLFYDGDHSDSIVDNVKMYHTRILKKVPIIQEKLGELNLTIVKGAKGFYLPKCSDVNEALERYNQIIGVIDNIVSGSGENMIRQFNAKVQAYGSEEAKAKAEEMVEDAAELKVDWDKYINSIQIGTINNNVTCEGLLGPDLLDDISTVLTWIRIAVPVIVIILGTVDFSKAVLSDDQQQLKKSTSTFVKRCIIAVAIFFAPSIIMFILSSIDMIADVSCDIRLW